MSEIRNDLSTETSNPVIKHLEPSAQSGAGVLNGAEALTSPSAEALNPAEALTQSEALPELNHGSLSEVVERTVLNYIVAVGDRELSDMYDLLLQEVEAPLLDVIMRNYSQNQSRAAKALGLNRGTLRKKLKRYDML